VVSGLRRGALQVFLPLALAGQAVAWLGYLISGAYTPWSWTKIGFAYALTGARVPFEVTARVPFEVTARGATEAAPGDAMHLALGAFTAGLLVLAFRAGREQAKGLETRPGDAAFAGSLIAPGVAIPMMVSAYMVRLGFPRLRIEVMEPVLWAAFVFPLVLAGLAGAVGGLAGAREALEARGGRRARLVEVARAGAIACWWGLVLATIGTLLLAAVEMGVTSFYGRFIGRSERAGAMAVVHHALALPNQSAMALGVAMGVPAELSVGEDLVATIGIEGLEATGDARGLFDDPNDPDAGSYPAPTWYWAFLVVPAAATIMGGRVAGEGARSPLAALWSGALAGVVAAALTTGTIWFASFALPLLPGVLPGSVRLGQPPGRMALAALAWGVAGCAIGAVGESWIRRRRA
jgi:hypothetical protein